MTLHQKLVEIQKASQNTSRHQLLEKLTDQIHRELVKELGPQLYNQNIGLGELRASAQEKLHQLIAREETTLSEAERARLLEDIAHDVLGYGPLEELLENPEITEIMVNNFDTVYVEKFGKIHLTDRKFLNEAHLRRIIDKIVAQIGRRVDESVPMVDARLPDGSRVNVIIPPLAIDGAKLTIRKFAADPYSVKDLISFGTMSENIAQFLQACVRGRLNILVSGGTGSGKTTTLNVLSSFLPDDERIVTIEDAAELQLRQDHVIRLESRPPNIEGKGQVAIRDLVRNSLRMRPDRIVVGEVRGGEALDMLQAMNTGHDGSLSTVHANSPRDVLSRLETMVLMAGMELPIRAIREQISSAINIIIHQARLRDGSRRITHITEIEGMEENIITLQDVFLFDFAMGVDEDGRFKGTIKSTGIRPRFMERLNNLGIKVPSDVFQFETFERR
jgi:pilus assembly protein CpaF